MEVLSAWAEQNDKGMDDALGNWSTVYTNISVIASRGTPFHHDPHSQLNWYDVLAVTWIFPLSVSSWNIVPGLLLPSPVTSSVME